MAAHTGSIPSLSLDMYACQCRLVWANSRRVESEYLQGSLNADRITICWYVREGAVTVTQKGRQAGAGPGEWIFPANVDGTQRIEAGTRLISIRFLLRHLGMDPVFDQPVPLVVSGRTEPMLKPAAEKLVRRAAPWNGRGALLLNRGHIPLEENFRIEAAFHEWMAAYTSVMFRCGAVPRPGQELDPRVRQALMTLEEMPLRETFSERELAARCGLSVNHLARLFKLETGMTPFAYFDRRRFEAARHALDETRLQVKEIAFDLGFSSSPHFSNWFKTRQGKGPREYRRRGN